MPQSLGEAADALDASDIYRADYLVMMKRFEIDNHAKARDASAWEMAEYFELF